MKKIIKGILAMLLLCVTACSSAAGSVQEEKDPMAEYVGKYLLIKMEKEGTDYNDFLKTSWENKTFYEYAVIGEDGKFEFYAYQDEKVTSLLDVDYYLNPETMELHQKDKEDAGEKIEIEDGLLTVVSGDSTLVFEKTDEIPD